MVHVCIALLGKIIRVVQVGKHNENCTLDPHWVNGNYSLWGSLSTWAACQAFDFEVFHSARDNGSPRFLGHNTSSLTHYMLDNRYFNTMIVALYI